MADRVVDGWNILDKLTVPEPELVEISQLKVDGQNPNRMTPKQLDALKKSIMRWGFIVPIITNKDFLIADGEQRLTAARELGINKVSVIRLPVEDVDRRLLRQVLNKLKGTHQELEDAYEFQRIIMAGQETHLKELLQLSDAQIERYLRIIREDVAKPCELNSNLNDVRILNLYAGIGGNRRFWGDLNVTAIEINKEIAHCYQTFFPNDTVIITDAHDYLEKHFSEYDFIWSSPPCPTHSQMRKNFGNNKPVYPDMHLYEEILFLQGYFDGKWIVENVISWYEPLIEPIIFNRHYF